MISRGSSKRGTRCFIVNHVIILLELLVIPSFVLISKVISDGFIVESDKLVPSEPRDHSIGTILMMSFLFLNPMGIKFL